MPLELVSLTVGKLVLLENRVFQNTGECGDEWAIEEVMVYYKPSNSCWCSCDKSIIFEQFEMKWFLCPTAPDPGRMQLSFLKCANQWEY